MAELFALAFTQQALLESWATVREAALADGRPDPEVNEFEPDAARRVTEIAEALSAGTWAPLPVRRVEIPKPSGGTRRLGVPALTDRIVERALLDVLDPVIDPRLLPWSFAYRRGMGSRDAVAALTEARDSGLDWVARADIEDCFERIPQWEVLRRLRDHVDDERVLHLVSRLLDRSVAGGRPTRADRGLGLHQGAVLSPLLSNLYLDTFDRRMLAAGFRVIRFADDFAIPVGSRVEAEKALLTAGTELADLRLELNTGKCVVQSFDDGVTFLGETVTASTLAPSERMSHPLETVVYIDRQGSVVRSRGDRLVVTDGEESLLRLGLRRVRQVVCLGRVQLTTPFLHTAAREGIDVVLLDEHGGPVGWFATPMTSDPTVRRAQYRATDDEAQARRLAVGFVSGKIGNMRVALLRAARRRDDVDALVSADRLDGAQAALSAATSVDQVLGVEGSASREYFQGLRRMAPPEWRFEGRQRRPPPDPINAMLSFGYTLLCQEAVAAAGAAGLDPTVGLLHRHRWGRPSLALDLMEEFRPITVDVAVWRCVATRLVRPEQFHDEPEQGCRMAPDAKHAFIAAYEKRMLTLTTHPPTGRRVSYRVALGLQAAALARALLHRTDVYVPMRWK